MAGVYSREIDGQALTLSASGWTYRNTFVLYDYESESLWYHLEGESGLTCISGKWNDRKLDEYPVVVMFWSEWVKKYPQTKYLTGGRGLE
ncbi:MAG: DUF3179 domain-containing protein [Calditrichaeota bacterium]|nr:MAG: DUF3179 domain-containing protein [Calditrichota bacterium]